MPDAVLSQGSGEALKCGGMGRSATTQSDSVPSVWADYTFIRRRSGALLGLCLKGGAGNPPSSVE